MRAAEGVELGELVSHRRGEREEIPQLRVVDSSQSCRQKEVALQWSQWMPLTEAYIGNLSEIGLGGGAFRAEYTLVNADTDQPVDIVHNLIATPITLG